MTPHFETIVVGLGAVGSATLYHLARRGRRVLGLDRFAPPHDQGSSHGESRIVRRAYFEGPVYLSTLQRAWELWRELEEASGQRLLTRCGSLNIGGPERPIIREATRSAGALGLPYERFSAPDARRRFPAFRVPEDHDAVLDVEAGLIRPEAAIRAHLVAASSHHADVATHEPVVSWHADATGVRVQTRQAAYQAESLVITTGGWMRDLMPELDAPLGIERVVNVWFTPATHREAFGPDRCPVFIWEHATDRIFYGAPDLGRGVKTGLHQGGETVAHPDEVRRDVTDDDVDELWALASRLLPRLERRVAHASVCFYTNTPDRHYLVGRHPDHPVVVYASPCSGHGFKAAPAIGEAVADLIMNRPPRIDLTPFRWRW